MLFRRKSKGDGRTRSGAGAKSVAKRPTATNSGGKGKTRKAGAGKPSKAASSDVKRGSKSAGGTQTGQQPQSRAQAEAQIKRMMSDGSLDKFKTLMRAQSPQDVADEYPQETVDLIRAWLHEQDKNQGRN